MTRIPPELATRLELNVDPELERIAATARIEATPAQRRFLLGALRHEQRRRRAGSTPGDQAAIEQAASKRSRRRARNLARG